MSLVARLLYPRLPRQRLRVMVRAAAVGVPVAAAYGMLHDQVSYAISPEYFTRLKFVQFAWADVGLPPRAFASEVGILATGWVGLVAGWVLGRIGFGDAPTRNDLLRAFAIVLGTAAACGTAGALLGLAVSRGDLSGWEGWRVALELTDVPAFVIVAWLHWSGYLGALLGLVLAIRDARQRRTGADQRSRPAMRSTTTVA